MGLIEKYQFHLIDGSAWPILDVGLFMSRT